MVNELQSLTKFTAWQLCECEIACIVLVGKSGLSLTCPSASHPISRIPNPLQISFHLCEESFYLCSALSLCALARNEADMDDHKAVLPEADTSNTGASQALRSDHVDSSSASQPSELLLSTPPTAAEMTATDVATPAVTPAVTSAATTAVALAAAPLVPPTLTAFVTEMRAVGLRATITSISDISVLWLVAQQALSAEEKMATACMMIETVALLRCFQLQHGVDPVVYTSLAKQFCE